jgi:hypothetical protein
MNKKLKLSALALIVAAAAVTAHAQTNLLQAVSVDFTFYSQGTPVVNSSGGTNNVVDHQGFGIKDLIAAVKGSAFSHGDILARLTPVPIYATNLVQVSTTNLVISNSSTSTLTVTNGVFFDGISNNILNSNVFFGTNVVDINGTNVTLGTNTAIVVGGGNTNALSFDIGTNTTVTTTILTNAAGYNVGTSNYFVIYAVNVITNNQARTGSWIIYNTLAKTTNAISTNVYFDIHTDTVYTSPTNLAYVHGETIRHNGEINFGTTDEIRTLILSNSTTQIKMEGYAHGHVVPVSLGGTPTSPVVYSQDYQWTGNGSGIISNTVPTVIAGDVSEDYLKLLK